MIASGARIRPDELAHQLFSVVTRFCLAMPRGRRRAGDLKEIEFLTLTILSSQGTMIVGDIQRMLGVLPAQMSRIIRSLESRERPYIACRINPRDKRKIDVCLTAAGDKALAEYRDYRVRGIAELLRQLSDDDLEEIHGVLEKLRLPAERSPSLS
jgi:DNA-binding MarR family transcriptional regulator